MSHAREESKTYASVEEWREEGRRLFGEDIRQWRFVCPSCKYVASVQDWKDAGAPESAVAFSCVGVWRPDCIEAFSLGRKGPCNYAGGGLIRIAPVRVGEHYVFAFAEATRQPPQDTE